MAPKRNNPGPQQVKYSLKDQATFTFGVRFTEISSTFRITALLAVSKEW